MKKRAMKKWIPKDTIYCGKCKWRHYLGTRYFHRKPENLKNIKAEKCEFADTCKTTCWDDNDPKSKCQTEIWKCDYLGLIDKNEETLLWDGCKECGVHYSKEFR